MPNWCSNNLEIKTTVDPEEFLVKEGDNYYLMFNKLVDIGEWDYDTAIQQWGTKWDIASFDKDGKICTDSEPVTREFHDNRSEGYWTYYLSYETAWAPPTEYINKLQAYLFAKDRLSHVVNEYFEPGMGFMGINDNGMDMETSWDMTYIEELEGYVCFTDDARYLADKFEECMSLSEGLEQVEKLFKEKHIDRERYHEIMEELNKE